jgi:beta-lactamase regulating signal transducer with metallopeptidase domain
METLANILSQEIILKLGWMLVHFVWEGAAIALILAAVLRMLRRYSANLRYITACIALGLIVLIPVATISLVDTSENVIGATSLALSELSRGDSGYRAMAEISEVEPQAIQATAIAKVSLKDRLTKIIEPALPYTVAGWLAGVFGLSLWYLGGWAQLQSLRQRMVKEVSERIHLRLKRLAERMEVKRVVAIMESALVQVPTVVGYLKPIILLPASALTGLSSEQIEAILAHELAHIKRCDYLVNILQTVVEVLGFYHPAVWWISHKIRVERENCCDDLAVSITGDRFRYARTLITMEEIRGENIALAVAASGGSLLDRICRLTSKGKRHPEKCNWLVPVLAILLMVSILVFISCQSGQTIAPKEKMHWNSIIAKLDIDNATAGSVKNVLGEPSQYIWGRQVFNRDALPMRYIMVYPGDFHVFIANDHVVEVRFEGPSDYVFGDGLAVGSTIDEVLRILGQPSEVVQGKPNRFKCNVFYKDIDGQKGYCYYAKPDNNIRVWISGNRVIAIYLTCSDYYVLYEPGSYPDGRAIADLNAKISQLDIDNAAPDDIKRIFGEPIRYVWGQQIFDKDALPDRYIVVYPGNFRVFIANDRIVEVRFEGPSDYVFDDGLSVGSSVEKAFSILGQPSEIVDGKPNGFKGNVFYKNIDGHKGYGYYARPDKNIRLWITDDEVRAIYLTRSDYYSHYEQKLEEVKIPETSFIDEHGHIVDKTDYPFVDDPEVLGGWRSVGFVRDINTFNPNRKIFAGDLSLKELYFLEGGKTNWAWSWTKGLLLGDKTASRYIVKDIDGVKYMFVEWKGGDYTIRHRKPPYFVLEKDPEMVYVESRTVDKVDYPFVDDPEVIGTWESVDFVNEIEDFKVGEKQLAGGDLFLKEIIFEDNGRATLKNEKLPEGYSRTWTKGLVLSEKEQTASRYIIREINGATYMFYQWKSGDYMFRHMKPAYYVLKKIKTA